jgi:hypothetical protein
MPTKAQLEEQLKAAAAEKETLKKEIEEAKRQSTHVPVTVSDKIAKGETMSEDTGAHALDHLTILDNHEVPDTNQHPAEDLAEKANADLSFWNNSWTWVHTEKSYGDRPMDSWFINPTSKLIGEVMNNAPTVFSACEVALIAGNHTEQLKAERERHTEFLQAAAPGDLISESLDLMTAYQSRYFEAVQRYIGQAASYENQVNSKNVDEDRLEQAQTRKEESGAQCRAWAARLIALREAYHNVVTDERAYNLTFNFAPLPPKDGQPPSREYSLYRWAITNTLNKIGRRLTRSIKDGKMDAEKYRIPRPWMEQDKVDRQLDTNQMLSDFG